MRKLTKTFCCIFVFLICITTFSACSNNPPPTTGGLLNIYKNDGYFEIFASPYLEIKCNENNTVTIASTTLYKENSIITFSLNDSAFQENGFVSSYVNIQTEKLFYGFNIAGKFVSIENINTYSFNIKKDTTITEVFLDTKFLGCAVYTISNFNDNADKFLTNDNYLSDCTMLISNKISTTDNFLFFSTESYSNTSSNTIVSNVANTNFYNKLYYFEIPLETTEIFSYLIFECENNLIFVSTGNQSVAENCFSELTFSVNNSSGLNSIVITTTNDLTTLNEYKK